MIHTQGIRTLFFLLLVLGHACALKTSDSGQGCLLIYNIMLGVQLALLGVPE